jgi:hypothetical protein
MILSRIIVALCFFFNVSILAEEENSSKKVLESLNAPFIAILEKGTIVVDHKTKQKMIVPATIKVKAKQHKIGGLYSDIYTVDGKKKYFTLTEYLVSVEDDKKLAPQVDHLAVYDYSGEKILYNSKFQTLSFIDYQLSFISTDYYAEIYRGTSTAAVESQLGIKQYFSHPTIPIDFGIAGSIHRGFYNDDVGTITWSSAFIGPTIHTNLWESEGGALHLHVSALKSLSHKSKFDPDEHKFSTNMLRIEISQSFKMRYGSFTLGGAINLSQSSIKETSEYLETNRDRDTVFGIGATIGFYKPWILNL